MTQQLYFSAIQLAESDAFTKMLSWGGQRNSGIPIYISRQRTKCHERLN